MLADFIDLYSLIVIASVIVSWLGLPPHNPLVRWTALLTEPLLAPIRSILPAMGGLDFSPMVLLILLQILKRLFIF